MANKVNKEDVVTLHDGTELKIRPLNIKGLRKFMDVVKRFGEISDDSDGLELMVEACQIALAKAYPEISEDRDYLEENLDLPGVYLIMEIAGGVDMAGDDANLTPRV